ncbi:MAG: hypothetical protein WAW37_14080 [Syntrophobacteraceae bacterium]
MVVLDEVKEIIGRADPNFPPDRYTEIEAAAVFEEGWLPIGEDHFYNEGKRLVAGPSEGGRTRILVSLAAITDPPAQDIALEWERQAGTGPYPAADADLAPEQPTPFADRGRPSSGKCACDS